MKTSPVLLSLATLLWPAVAAATLHTESVEYRHGETVLEGYLAYDDSVTGKRPGVLVAHDWMGVGPHVKERASDLAKLGYIAFAADIYGKGVRPESSDEAAKLAGTYKADRALLRARAKAALEILKKHPLADGSRLAAIGYCFGGTTVLELARSGAEVVGTVSFHGSLDASSPGDARNIKGKVLVLHGADDPFVPPEQVLAFQEEMRKAGVDWQIILYGNAVHSFTVLSAGSDNSKGAAYHEKADRRSWEAMKQFFAEVFK